MDSTWQCPKCGAPLEYTRDVVITCTYCGAKVIVPAELRGEKTLEAGSPTQPEQPMLTPPEGLSSPSTAELESELRNLLQQGQKIMAIKRYREIYSTGLKESKDAVEAFEQGGALPVPVEPSPPKSQTDSEAIQEIIRVGLEQNTIEAIKLYRQKYDVGLAEAKLVVEQLLADAQKDPAWAAEIAREKLAADRAQAMKASQPANQTSNLFAAFTPCIVIVVFILAVIVVLNLIITGKPF